MADPYWRYSFPPERGSTPKPLFPGNLSSEASTLTTYHQWSSNGAPGSADFLQKDFLPSHPGAYGIDAIRGIQAEPSAGGGLPIGIRHKDYPSPLRDSSSLGQRIPPGVIPKIKDRIYERPNSLRKADPVASGDSNILFVDGLPTDCTRRESGDKAMVLCFVEFTDTRCALTAMEALQGYKFDDRKPDSSELKIHFANFPFRLPSHQDDQRLGSVQQS